jgi:hypothetical protein
MSINISKMTRHLLRAWNKAQAILTPISCVLLLVTVGTVEYGSIISELSVFSSINTSEVRVLIESTAPVSLELLACSFANFASVTCCWIRRHIVIFYGPLQEMSLSILPFLLLDNRTSNVSLRAIHEQHVLYTNTICLL